MNKVLIKDIFKIKSVAGPKVVPNSERVTYYVTHLDKNENKYITQLHEFTGIGTHQLTYDDEGISNVEHSEDGNYTIFIAKGDNDKPQVFLWRATRGEREQLTDEKYGVSQALFCKHGKKVYYHVNEPVEESDNQENKEKFPEPVVINNMKYKMDGEPGPFGYVEESYQKVKYIVIESREVNTVLSGKENFTLLAPMEGGFVYTTDRSNNRDFNFNNQLYYRKHGKDKKIELEEGSAFIARISEKDNYILIVSTDDKYKNASHPVIEVYDVEKDQLIDVTRKLDRPAGNQIVQDTQQNAEDKVIAWVSDEEFVFLLSEDGSVNLYKGNVNGQVEPLLQGRHNIFGMDANSYQVYLTISTHVSPSELYSFNLKTKELSQLTEENMEYVKETQLIDPEDIRFDSFDGEEIQGWFMKPANFKKGKTYPMITNVHGGPHAFYANTFFHEMQVLAAEGYAVLFVNPRGSHSYSQRFVDLVRGDYGNGDYKDIMSAVDYITEKYDFLDQENLGVTGGSYGGFMTNWIIGHTDKFKAAVTQRSISNWISFRGVSDIGYYFTDWQIGAGVDDVEKLWNHSPLKYVDHVNTPLLLLHSEYDFRCPIEQAEQFYTELKYRGKTAEFVRFPEADHNLSRNGKPNLRVKRLEYMTEWFRRYLEQ